ncbi:CAP domain-containing protein [Methyloraptor flagellatus]|uniref:CAP domain-containing protein n=1 Tax=Methyloraptor flagellatus TaxID=3162530 RepID=A0AAU7X8I9_9HYPH
MDTKPTRRAAPTVAVLALVAAGLALAACSRSPVEPAQIPPFYQRLDIGGRQLDPGSSLSMINQYRANNGLRPLVWDETLTRVAKAQADRMAANDRVHSVEEGQLGPALKAAGVPYKTFAANFSAGYRTFAEAFSGWRDSKVHNATMLDSRATRIGLAISHAPSSKYQIFWALVVVDPQ